MPIEHHDGFLQDIIAHPDDDTPRLVYADWFEDTGAPSFVAYAEYIRLECERAKLPGRGLTPPEPDQSRSAALLAAHVRKWNGLAHRLLRGGPFHHQVDSRWGLVRGWQYGRGFVAGITATADALVTGAAELFRLGPIEGLKVVRIDHHQLGELLAALLPFRLRALELRLLRYRNQRLDALLMANRPWLAQLESLRLVVGGPNVRWVLRSNDVPNLKAAGIPLTIV